MKPFNLEKAKAGEKVQTRDRRAVRIIDFNLKDTYPIVAAIMLNVGTEIVLTFTESGEQFKGETTGNDLFMAEGSIVIKKIIKPFDVELAKKGAKVQTKSGADVKIIKYGGANEDYPITAEIRYQDDPTVHSQTYTLNGFYNKRVPDILDLVIVEDEDISTLGTTNLKSTGYLHLSKELIEELKKQLIPEIVEEVKKSLFPVYDHYESPKMITKPYLCPCDEVIINPSFTVTCSTDNHVMRNNTDNKK